MTQPRTISYDSRAISINGERTFIKSGAIHYPRSTPAMWPDMMKRSRDLGLNAIETYVFWGLHEPERGRFDFTGRLDLNRFIEAAAKEKIDIILRIGPYICAEINYGGFPAWLRDVPAMQMRTWNEPFMREMARFVRLIGERVDPYLASNGGPIILAQIENEYSLVSRQYGQEGERYLQWSIDLGQSMELELPWVMCFGGMPGAIETINAFYGHQRIDTHVQQHPDQPILWTENWTGWYDLWGYPHNVRSAEDEAYGVARFVAAGGTGVNYYMWHGGTNFGREAMYLQTTSYDYDAPLDEFGLPTTKARHLASLHRALKPYEPLLLRSPRPTPRAIADGVLAFDYADDGGTLTFLCNDAIDSRTVRVAGVEKVLPGRSALLMTGNRIVFDTAQTSNRDRIVRKMLAHTSPRITGVRCELPPGASPNAVTPAARVAEPVEQLGLTRDETDYCWYSATIAGDGQPGALALEHASDVVHVFVDGALRATTTMPLLEDRGDLNSPATTQRFQLTISPGEHQLDLLACAIGMIKGDWMIGHQNMVNERKGIWGAVTWEGQPVTGGWALRPGLDGERQALGAARPIDAWSAPTPADTGAPLRWWRLAFDRPSGDAPLAADLAGMGKGLAWLNGRCIGRYWLIAGAAQNRSHLADVGAVTSARVGEPSQRYYHLPSEWLIDGENQLIFFEETGGDPATVRICDWIEEKL